ncbi:MAG: acyltransferase family protein [Microthrixaceae bacterium]
MTATTERTAPRLAHQPALDGIRGIAVAAVVLYHAAAADGIGALERVTHGGFLGVSAFFTLSGFLICSLLLRERAASGTVSLSAFWARRARRLLPAVLVLIGAVVVLTPLVGTESQLASLPGDAWSSLLYVANWHFVLDGSDYSAMFAGAPSPLRHVWSLAVEEQWYVLVPLAALVVAVAARRSGRPRRRLLLWGLVGVSVAGTAWMVLVSGGGWDNRAYMGTDTRLAEMAVGAVLAVLLADGFTAAPRVRRALTRIAPVVLIALVVTWALTPIRAAWLYRGGLTAHAVAVALLIAAVVQPDGLVRKVLANRWVAMLGVVSYGVYLFHWPVVWWVTPQRLGLGPWPTLAMQLALTLALAGISYKLIEHPIRRGRAWSAPKLAFAGTAAVALLVFGIVNMPEPDRSQVLALGSTVDVAIPTTPPVTSPPVTSAPADTVAGDPTTTTTTTTAPPPPLRVMVVGDSFGESVVVGLQKWGLLDGGMAVMDRTIPGCPFGRGGRNRGVGIPRNLEPVCEARDETLLNSVKEFDPEVVVFIGGMWDVTDRRPPGFDSWTRIGRADYDAYLRTEIDHLIDIAQSGGAEVLWANSPYWEPVPGSVIFMGNPPYAEAERDRVDLYNQLLAERIAARGGAEILDIAGWLRSQPGGEFAPALRPDGVHFSEASTDTVAGWLGPTILSSAGR